ncbi:hypothetical protein QJ850_gp041 [Acanthamoeba polyphaga mimivirus]|uniref:Uncharacterized protein n=1 Tax=Acanthamoeba polyphaga mimivirus Kroon TaxID=3069720 RepID=A0A0G2Y4C4_9VIRU|nr:hypothetical protein QJ850_gp041 [Acanthamoeba polyphaga mimivirus]AKI80658.1 hypothetical protein [Acanthamoeba polyphaga mimivirus Kroon]
MTHEALFYDRISIKFVIGVICEKNIEDIVKKYLNKFNLHHIKIFNKFIFIPWKL